MRKLMIVLKIVFILVLFGLGGMYLWIYHLEDRVDYLVLGLFYFLFMRIEIMDND